MSPYAAHHHSKTIDKYFYINDMIKTVNSVVHCNATFIAAADKDTDICNSTSQESCNKSLFDSNTDNENVVVWFIGTTVRLGI